MSQYFPRFNVMLVIEIEIGHRAHLDVKADFVIVSGVNTAQQPNCFIQVHCPIPLTPQHQ